MTKVNKVLVQQETAELWDTLRLYDTLGIDIETTGLDPHVNTIISVQIATTDMVYILDFRRGDFSGLGAFLESYKGLCIFQNAKFDLKFLYKKYKVIPDNLGDTHIAERLLLTPEEGAASLEALTLRYLGIQMSKNVVKTFLDPLFQNLDLTEEQLEYAALDAHVLQPIYEIQLQKIKETGQERVLDLELQFLPVLMQAELTGITLDVPAWTLLYKEAEKQAAELHGKLQEAAGDKAFNPNSSKQLLEIMRRLNIEIPIFQSKETTKEEHIARINHPFIKMLLEYRHQAKLASTYGKHFLKYVHPITRRIHCSFSQLGTETGRLSAKAPNLQNIPGEEEMRSCFIASPNHKIISADFSMQEVVIQAELSQDPALIKILNEGIDRHRATAAILFNVDYEAVTKEQRSKGKTFNFGIGYGSSAWNMANKLELPERLVEKALDTYWETFEVLRKFNLRTGLIAYRDGYSTTALGRRRQYVNLDKKKVMRLAANHVVQGTAADMTKLAAVLIYNFIKENEIDATIINFVHDEIEIEVADDDADALAHMVGVLMERAGAAFLTKVTQKAEVKVGDTWQK